MRHDSAAGRATTSRLWSLSKRPELAVETGRKAPAKILATFKTVTALLRAETLPISGTIIAYFYDLIQSLKTDTQLISASNLRERRWQIISYKTLITKDKLGGGPSRNRTGVRGFAVLYVTTPPSGLMPIADLPQEANRGLVGSASDGLCRSCQGFGEALVGSIAIKGWRRQWGPLCAAAGKAAMLYYCCNTAWHRLLGARSG